jgi:DNA polymerase
MRVHTRNWAMSDSQSMDNASRLAYLRAMGVQQWVHRDTGKVSAVPPETNESLAGPSSWEQLESDVSGCTKCGLHVSRTQTVFGVGNRQADWMIIGEAPGAEEDRQGEPFVGRAGLLLNEMLSAAGYQRTEVYIANILKCRPPSNRDPSADEMACCEPWLQQQIAMMQPQLILAVGRIAAHGLLKTSVPVGRLRGTVHHYGNGKIPVIVTYHPAYLLRSPLEKRKVWEDLQFAQSTYRQQLAGQKEQ